MSLKLTYYPITYKLKKSIGRKPWDLSLPFTSNWGKKKRRVLFVVDHVPTQDLEAKTLLSDVNRPLFMNVLKQAFSFANSWGCKRKMDDFGYGWVNFNFFKTYDMTPAQQTAANKIACERLQLIIDKFKPTHVHFFGTTPFYLMYGEDVERRGWVFEKDGMKVSSNISVTRSGGETKEEADDEDDFDDENEYGKGILSVVEANLLGHASENLARLINGGYPFSLKHIKPSYTLIDKMGEWKKLLKRLRKSKLWAFDTETYNLSVTQNGLSLIQFSFDEKHSYIVPCKSVSSPWNSEQLRVIFTDLRKLFSRKFDQEEWKIPVLIGQNLEYDLRIMRQELAIPVIYYRTWDTMIAEYCLDENLKSVRTKSSKAELQGEGERDRPWALDNLFTRYENDFYYTASFSKADRNEGFANVKLTKPVLRYGAMDTQAPFGIRNMQIARAKLMKLGNKPFLPKYIKLVTGLYNDAIHTTSTMKQNGAPVNRDYIIEQFAEETSGIFKEQKKVEKELYSMKPVRKANRRLLKARALPEHGLFAGTSVETKNWDFDIYTQEHQHLLFFDVMKLKPVDFTDSGKPSIGKAFIAKYRDNPVVAKFGIITEAKKAHSYVKSYFNKVSEPDGQFHSRIHASYGFVGVNTGRSNSFDPSFQQVPTHGTYAKIVKECFASPDGQITIKMDYKAHEVSVWSLISADDRLANTFKRIWNLWCEYRLNPNDPKFAPDEKGDTILDLNDVHRVNYSGFTGVPVGEVTKVQRQSSKGITFGVMFGKAVRSLARELGYTDEEMQEIFDRFFGEFENAERFLKWTVAHARKHFYTYNLFGFRRNLWGHLTGIRSLQAAMDRRAQNSPIQGMASQISFVAARLLCIRMDQLFTKHKMYGKPKWDKKLARFTMKMPDFALNIMVHDSTETRASYELAPLVKQAMEHCATTGVMKYITKMYDIKFQVRPLVDLELMDSGGKVYGYDFTHKAWKKAIKSSAKDANKRGNRITKRMVRNAIKPTKNVKKLMKEFPLDLRMYKGVD